MTRFPWRANEPTTCIGLCLSSFARSKPPSGHWRQPTRICLFATDAPPCVSLAAANTAEILSWDDYIFRTPARIRCPELYNSQALTLHALEGPGECGTGSLTIIDLDHLCLLSHLSLVDQHCLPDQHRFRDEYGLLDPLVTNPVSLDYLNFLDDRDESVTLTTVVFGTRTVSLTIFDFDGVMVSPTTPLIVL